MVTARGRRELARTASWSSVRSGLSWLIGAWLVLTLGSVGVQLQNMQLAPGIAAKDPGALIVMTVVSAGYQLFYVLVSVALVVALVRLTRVPPSSRAVTPAVVATFSFVLVGLASLVLLLGMGSRSSEAISERELWLLAAVARTAGLLALGLALTRMAAALRVRLPPAAVGATFAFVLIDTRHGVKAVDEEILTLLDKSAVTVQVVMTKADKVNRETREANIAQVKAALGKHPAAYPEIIVTSSEKGEGVETLRAIIATLE